jgi:hypothetical protein
LTAILPGLEAFASPRLGRAIRMGRRIPRKECAGRREENLDGLSQRFAAVLYHASPASGYVTGAILSIDGAYTAWCASGEARPSSDVPSPSLVDRLKFGRLLVLKLNEAAVDLAQIIEKYRDADIFLLVARLQRSKPAVKEGVFHSVNQMRNDSFQPEGESFVKFMTRHKSKHQYLSDFIDFALSEILGDKAIP